MKDIKMKVAGVVDDKILLRPVIILKNRSGKIFPVPSSFHSTTYLVDAFLDKSDVHSELETKLIELVGSSIGKVVLEKNKVSKLVAKVYSRASKNSIIEMSPTAGILLCVKINKPVIVKLELFKDKTFFKDKIDKNKMINNSLSKMFFEGVDHDGTINIPGKEKETIQ